MTKKPQTNRRPPVADALPDEVLEHKPDILPAEAAVILAKHESRPHKLPRFAVVPTAKFPQGIRMETATLTIGLIGQVIERETRLARRAIQAYHRQGKYPGRNECNAKTAALHAGLARQFAHLLCDLLGMEPADADMPFGEGEGEDARP